MTMTRQTLLLAALFLCGCAGQAQMRNVAAQTVAALAAYRQDFGDFAAAHNDLNAENQKRLEGLASITAGYQSEIGLRQQVWTEIKAVDALTHLQAYTELRADDILKPGGPVNPTPPAPATPALNYDPAQIAGLVQKLLDLSKPTSLRDRVGDFIDFTSTLRTDLRQDVANGATGAKNAIQAAATTTKDLVKP
jgi:hypothetical protein